MAQENEMNALGDKLNAVLSDPESMEKLMKMASTLAGSGLLNGLVGAAAHTGDTAASDAGDDAEEEAGDAQNTSASADGLPNLDAVRQILPVLSGKGKAGSKHAALLNALRPYLGEQKQERIDRMLKLLQLAELADAVLNP